MKTSEIEPGMIVIGTAGQRREVITMDGDSLTYAQVSGTNTSMVNTSPKVGEVRTTLAKTFAEWAVREAPDKARIKAEPVTMARKDHGR